MFVAIWSNVQLQQNLAINDWIGKESDAQKAPQNFTFNSIHGSYTVYIQTKYIHTPSTIVIWNEQAFLDLVEGATKQVYIIIMVGLAIPHLPYRLHIPWCNFHMYIFYVCFHFSSYGIRSHWHGWF